MTDGWGQRPPAAGATVPSWWSDALADPWRDPAAPAAVVLTPSPAGPALEPPEEPGPARVRPGLGLLLLVTAVTALLAGALGGTLGYVFASRQGLSGSPALAGQSPGPLTQRPPDSLAGLVKKVLPGVVTIIAPHSGGLVAEGSGFVVSSDGYVITNDHVVTGATGQIVVRFSDGTAVAGRVVGSAVESDVAVVKIDRSNLAPVEFGDSDAVQVGDPVLAIGSPQGLFSTVTSGIVSAVDRTFSISESGAPVRYYAAIQTDATMDHGSSGGPLFDASGRVVGINSSGSSPVDNAHSAIGFNFAIPINQAKRLAQEIISTGTARRTVIGAEFDTLFSTGHAGVRLSAVEPGGPAANAGLRVGDVLSRLDGRPLEQPTDAIALVRKQPPGGVVSVEYQRSGESRAVRVTLAADAR